MAETFTFDRDRGYHLFVGDSYEGGPKWLRPSSPDFGLAKLYGRVIERDSNGVESVSEKHLESVNSYLVPWPAETRSNFERRNHLAVYVNVTESVVDAYVDAIAPAVTRSLGTLDTYLSNTDGQHQTWATLVSNVTLQTALDGVTAVVIDRPPTSDARTRAEEVASGIGLRATVIPVASWAWLAVDDDGAVAEFAYLDALAAAPTTGYRSVLVWVWSRTGWAVYRWALTAHRHLVQDRDAIVGSTPVREGSYAVAGAVPVVLAYNRRSLSSRAPCGKSIAATAASVGRQIFQVLSDYEDTTRRAPSFLAVPTRSTNGLEPETAAKVGPDTALPIPEGAGAPQWVTHPTDTLAEKRAHVAFLLSLAYRMSGLELQADTSAQVQSGEALRVRSRGFEAAAKKLAAGIEDFERRALNLCALTAGVSPDYVVTYPKRYVLGETSELLAAASLLLTIAGDRLGPTGVSEVVRQAIGAALTLDDAQTSAVMAEVDARLNAATPGGA